MNIMANFIFNYLKSYKNKSNNIEFDYSSHFTFDDGCLYALKNNKRDSYKKVVELYEERQNIFDIEPYEHDYIILDKSYVNNEGIIMTNNLTKYVNGGCLCGNMNHSFDPTNSTKIESAITITALWSDGIWHFPFEAFVSLMCIPQDILDKSKIHVSKKSKYILQWFELLNIHETKIITGNIFANTLYIPRMGKCGNPYYSQIQWLKKIVNKNISSSPCIYFILIKRNNRRRIKNYDALETLIKNFCKNTNLTLYIHDDNNLPTLIEQQQIFSKAKIVFAPHGAGGINIISMKPSSWYIEFLSVEDINICYSRLSYLCNINYKGISMSNLTIDLHKVVNILLNLRSIIMN